MTEPGHVDDSSWALSKGLAGYLRAVAAAVGVPAEGTTCEISDTATAYLALTRRCPARPGRDLMLVWSERTGWTVSVETDPDEAPITIARIDGDLLPSPETVARFVTNALGHHRVGVKSSAVATKTNRVRLAKALSRYIT